MTSKEALKRLDQETISNTYMADFDKKECVKVVDKDLQVLEILKACMPDILLDIHRNPTYEEYTKSSALSSFINNCPILTKEEWKLLKEWLNEK